jgi:hypothetical protein
MENAWELVVQYHNGGSKMAACKCRYCQTSLTTAIAYMEYVGTKKAYFCNQEHHEKYVQKEENKKRQQAHAEQMKTEFYNLMCEILCVKGITNTALWKEKTEINKVFPDDVIVAYLKENKDWICASVSRLNGGEYGKIRYVSVILRNKLGDYKPKVMAKEEKPKPQVDVTFYEPVQTNNNKRRSLADLEDDF